MTKRKNNTITVAELKSLDQDKNTPFESIYLLREAALKTARNGTEFLSVELGDTSGSFHFVCFNETAIFLFFHDTPIGSVVRVQGVTEYYQNRFSPRIQYADVVPEEEVNSQNLLDGLIPSSLENRDDLWAELQEIVNEIGHEGLRATVGQALSDWEDRFKTCAAAISMHHAYRGGLIEHTVHLCRACKALLPHYPEVNPDLVLSGLILHDVGKILEYEGDRVTKRSRRGILQGHVVLGYRIVRKAALQNKLEPGLRERLEHIILSHQGQLEWGAAVLAAMPEAVFVSLLDNLDAKMGMVQEALRSTPAGKEFSDYMPGLGGTILVSPVSTPKDERES